MAEETKGSDKAKVAKKQNKPKQSKFFDARSVLMLLLAVSAGFFGGWFGGQQQSLSSDNTANVTREVIESEGNLINTIAKDVSPSVVSINVTGTSTSIDFFGFGQELESQSAGSGFIISKEGLIVTNRHVVPTTASNVKVVLSDDTEFEAEVVGRTNESDPLDIAFLKIKDLNGHELTPAKLGNSEELEIGDRVVAIGNALGEFQNTVTSGIISGFGRDIEAYDGSGLESLQNLIQTDAAINSGNSGGPLVNAASEVIGINVATASAENISFAIPINDVKSLIDTVLAEGKLERPYLGVRYVTLNETTVEQLDLDVTQGAYIPRGSDDNPSIITGSPADKAGLQPRDIIIEIDGTSLDDDNSLVTILSKKKVGDSVQLKVIRAGEEVTLTAVLEAAPQEN